MLVDEQFSFWIQGFAKHGLVVFRSAKERFQQRTLLWDALCVGLPTPHFARPKVSMSDNLLRFWRPAVRPAAGSGDPRTARTLSPSERRPCRRSLGELSCLFAHRTAMRNDLLDCNREHTQNQKSDD